MCPAQGRPNILVLLLDSVPSRRLGCYGYGKPTTPNLDRLAQDGARFADVTSTGCQSPPSHASLFTGLYPDWHTVLRKSSVLPPGIPTLAEVLDREGYSTWCISNKLDVGRETGLDRGFQRIVEMRRKWVRPVSGIVFRVRRYTMNLNGLLDDGAASSNRKLLRWIDGDGGTRPFFAFINYGDAHYPYGAPRPFRFRFTRRPLSISKTWKLYNAGLRSEEFGRGELDLTDDEIEDMTGLFDGGLAYLDHKVGQLLEGLRRRKILDRTLVVVLSDHGEYFGEHGRIGHGQALYRQVLRIPLIMRLPGTLAAGTVENRPAQICDVFPTILEVASVDPDRMRGVDGVSLISAEKAKPFREHIIAFYADNTAQLMIRRGNLKYIRGLNGGEELYDLDADPGEINNLAEARPEDLVFLRDQIDSFLARRKTSAPRPMTPHRAHDEEGRPRYALGINYYDHDSAVALTKNGRIVFAIAEERLSRLKKDHSFPHRAVRAALDHEKISFAEIDQVCFGWQKPGASFAHDLTCHLTGKLPLSSQYVIGSGRRLLRELNQQGGAKLLDRHFGGAARPVQFVDHHYAHALSAFLLSGFPDASVLIVDGRGAWEATTMWRAGGGDCVLIDSHPHPDSLGFFYAAFTDYLGFRRNSDEWKVMGLAPYGKPGVGLGRYITVNEHGYHVAAELVMGRYYGDVRPIVAEFGAGRQPEGALTDREKNIAYAVQDICEEAMMALAKGLVERTGLRKLCLAGGVAMNSKANGRILASGLLSDIFIQPAATDDGTAIGAAMAAARMAGEKAPGYRLEDVNLGPEYADGEIESLLRTCKISFTRPADVSRAAAELVAGGKIVGWFQGRMEFGPRALGNRSILADARDAAMRDRVNAVAKFREGWRPFAPSVLVERAEEFFIGCKDSPFMILTFPVREEMKGVIPAVTHVDGSARVQTVKRDVNPRYHALIEHFGRITGVPVVMNTSFNLRDEPIVCSPRDAIRTFYSSGLDALALGPFLVLK